MTISHRTARRSFVRRLSTTAASMGAMLGGLVPELSRAAGPVGSATPPPPEGSTAALTSQSQLLSAEAQNALYSSAIGDRDVAAIGVSLGESLRIDPPASSTDTFFSGGHRLTAVVLPLVSYTTGRPVAYLYFGTTTVVDSNGVAVTLPVRLAVGNDGVLRAAMDGAAQVAPASAASPGVDALFATWFPDEYIASVERANPLAPGRTLAPGDAQGGFMRKVIYADGDGKLADCRNAYRLCLRGATYACATAAIGAVVCTVVLIAGCSPQPLFGATCYGASLFCVGVLIAATVCGLQMTYCRNDFLLCRSKIGAGGRTT